MKVTTQLIDNFANLAKLEFDENEKEALKDDLQNMIAFVEKLNEVDTTGVEPLLFISSQKNVFREDEVKGSATREEALMNARVKDEQFFKVPKVINK
jgi:aspartyl-tRNA(Asn)/glutamyl-tRNA(Gln) amidotransferase subunit C